MYQEYDKCVKCIYSAYVTPNNSKCQHNLLKSEGRGSHLFIYWKYVCTWASFRAHPSSYPMIQTILQAISSWVKLLGYEADHSPPSNAERVRMCTSTYPSRLHGVVLNQAQGNLYHLPLHPGRWTSTLTDGLPKSLYMYTVLVGPTVCFTTVLRWRVIHSETKNSSLWTSLYKMLQ